MIVNGLIGVNNGIVRDLVINSGEVHGGRHTGSVVGSNYGNIINCGNKSNVTGDGNYVGGVCGNCDDGLISGCFNSGKVIGNGSDFGESDVGGIVGWFAKMSSMFDCYNLGDVVGAKKFAARNSWCIKKGTTSEPNF